MQQIFLRFLRHSFKTIDGRVKLAAEKPTFSRKTFYSIKAVFRNLGWDVALSMGLE